MSLLHVSINAENPRNVAEFLSLLMGGQAMPFPPFPDSWIAFTEENDGSAIEVYPLTHTLRAGEYQILCEVGERIVGQTFVHAAIKSSMSESEIMEKSTAAGWLARRCNRGPFHCIEIWIESRLLIEVLDPKMQVDYKRGMTIENWARMFGLELPS